MGTVRFETPAPLVPRSNDDRAEFAATLRARPGVWALLGKVGTQGGAGQHAYEIRNALHRRNAMFAPAGSFESVSRDLFGEFRVWVRYVGPVVEQPAAPVEPDSLAAAHSLAAAFPNVHSVEASGYGRGVEIVIQPADEAEWSDWQRALSCSPHRTTYRGSVATAHGVWQGAPVSVLCDLGRINAARRERA